MNARSSTPSESAAELLYVKMSTVEGGRELIEVGLGLYLIR